MTLVLCIVMIATVPVGNVSNETIRSAHNLASSLACDTDRQRPFELSATVNFAALGSDRLVALEDMSGHVTAFDRRENGPDLSAGDVIRCSGAIIGHVRGQHAIITNIQRISRQPPKSPVLTTIGELRSGRLDHQTVRLNGKIFDIRASETSPAWMLLTIAKDGMSINASLASEAPLPASREDLIGSDVTITGVCLPRELGPRKHLGRVIKAYGLSSAVISRKAPDNWHDFPDLARLNTMSADKIPPFKRHKAAGMVLAVWNDQALIETTNSIPVRISFVSSKSPAVGQFIEVVGHPETDLFNLILSHAIWREIAKTSYQPSDESKEPIEIAEVSNVLRRQEEYHGRTVSITGRVINMPDFNLNCGPLEIFYNNCIISIYVDPRWEIVSSLKIGSLVSVKGSCIVEAEHWHPYLVYPKALGFFIITRTSSDIRIISHPPWWTVGRLLAVIGTLLAILVGILIWNLALRHLAARKGRELFKEQLGHVKADLRTEERTRLAVELHDTLAQNLTGVSMEIEAANDLHGTAPKPMLDHLGIAAKALKSCRDELRNCLWDLRSQALEEPDMAKAVLRTLQPHVNDSQLSVRFNVPRARLSDNTAHALLRVIRELVINAIRHGEATSVKVAGTIDGDKLLCSVTDNGKGFDPGTAPGILQGHFGLQGIRERIDDLGGEFSIRSLLGKGTKATISVPIPHAL